jgi:nitrogen fixation protein FixH
MRIFIILISIIAIGITITTIVIGVKTFDGTVVERPYETGLAWDATHRNKERLGWKILLKNAPFRRGKNDLLVTILDRDSRPVADAFVNVTVSRPSTGSFDSTYPARRELDGRYRVSIDLPKFGYWDIRVKVSRNKDQCDFTNRIYAEKAG